MHLNLPIFRIPSQSDRHFVCKPDLWTVYDPISDDAHLSTRCQPLFNTLR